MSQSTTKDSILSIRKTLDEFILIKEADGYSLFRRNRIGSPNPDNFSLDGELSIFDLPTYVREFVDDAPNLNILAEQVQASHYIPGKEEFIEAMKEIKNRYEKQRINGLSDELCFDDYLVPSDYEMGLEDTTPVVLCHACKGVRIFYNSECPCLILSPNGEARSDCEKCLGQGVYAVKCPTCESSGILQAKYLCKFVNDETSESVAIMLDAHNPPPWFLELNYDPEDPSGYKEWKEKLPLGDILEEVCERLGVSKETHFMYYDGRPVLDWGIPFRNREIASWQNRDNIVKQTDHKTGQLMTKILANYVNPGEWHFRPRRTLDELLDDLFWKAEVRGYTFAISVRSGNIESGKAGWQVVLVDAQSHVLHGEIGISYDLDAALQEAWDNIDGFIDELNRE
ncbi:MAG: hypothetical protein R3346_02535 [Candidatus Spechtbacterales bacterium]|nr:hypothetical protein [Candidatus Spechtbacterales bacterium]